MTITVEDISQAVMLIIRLGVVARLLYCLIRLGAADEEAGQYKKRAKNAVVFLILAESIWAIKDLILWYYR